MTIMDNIFLNALKRSLRSVAVDDERLLDCEYFDSCIDVREITCVIRCLPMERSKAFLLYADGYKCHEPLGLIFP